MPKIMKMIQFSKNNLSDDIRVINRNTYSIYLFSILKPLSFCNTQSLRHSKALFQILVGEAKKNFWHTVVGIAKKKNGLDVLYMISNSLKKY